MFVNLIDEYYMANTIQKPLIFVNLIDEFDIENFEVLDKFLISVKLCVIMFIGQSLVKIKFL